MIRIWRKLLTSDEYFAEWLSVLVFHLSILGKHSRQLPFSYTKAVSSVQFSFLVAELSALAHSMNLVCAAHALSCTPSKVLWRDESWAAMNYAYCFSLKWYEIASKSTNVCFQSLHPLMLSLCLQYNKHSFLFIALRHDQQAGRDSGLVLDEQFHLVSLIDRKHSKPDWVEACLPACLA